MNFGQTLRSAREAAGLTPAQLADRTHILVQIINDMENEDFRRIPAAIYGRGFVRHYCECVGLDPTPLIPEFMAIFNGNKPARANAAEVLATAAPPPPPPAAGAESAPATECAGTDALRTAEPAAAAAQPQPEPVSDVPASVRGLDLFESASNPPPAGGPAPYVSPFASDYADAPDNEDNGPSPSERFRSQLSVVSHGVLGRVAKIPRSTYRKTLLILAAVVVVVAIVRGVFALYRATSPEENAAPTEIVPAAGTSKPAATKPAAQPAARPKPVPAKNGKLRVTGQTVKPIYVN